MKSFIFSILITFCIGISYAQVYNGDLTLHYQWEVDNFNYTEVNGNLSINGYQVNGDIENLDGLSELTSVTGSLEIYRNDPLSNIDGLSSLTSVGQRFLITLSPSLSNVDGLSSLASVGGDLYFGENHALVDINGLSNLTSVGGRFSIIKCISLVNVDGLSNLTSVGGSYIWLNGNFSLANIDGLTNLNLATIPSIMIRANYALTNVNPLSELTSVAGNLWIDNNHALADLSGLSNITSVGGSVIIGGTNSISSIDALSNLISVGSLEILDMGLVTNLDGLRNLSYTKSVSISDMDALTDISALDQITALPENLILDNNDALTNINGLQGVDYVGGDLQIKGNFNLLDLDGLSNLGSVGGDLQITENASLENIYGLQQLVSVHGDLTITNNDNLTFCCGLYPLLTYGSVYGWTEIYANGGFGCTRYGIIEGGQCCKGPFYITAASYEPIQVNTVANLVAYYFNCTPESATWDWGDGTQGTGLIGEMMITGEHSYTEPGVYSITLTVDESSNPVASYNYIVVYDPNEGFVTGGGWINSPAGASIQYPDAVGKATFGFVSKYKKGATVPTGNTEFQFQAGDLNFKSDLYDWLVIAGSKAMFKGEGTINGTGNYGFGITTTDGDLKDKGEEDKFRIVIWEMPPGYKLVYDNELGDPDITSVTTDLGGGSIVISRGNVNKSASVTNPDVDINIYPNPFDKSIKIDLFSESSQNIIIDMIDMNGRVVEYLYTGVIAAEVDHHFEFNTRDDLNPGSYMLRIITEERVLLGREIVIKR